MKVVTASDSHLEIIMNEIKLNVIFKEDFADVEKLEQSFSVLSEKIFWGSLRRSLIYSSKFYNCQRSM